MMLPFFSCHDDKELIRLWRDLAVATGMREYELCKTPCGESVIWLCSKAVRTDAPALYLSAGIHGDEPAGSAGLLAWAYQHMEVLRHQPLLIFPCLNPVGLRLNTRVDETGEDLNRLFQSDSHHLCGPWRRLIESTATSLAICLHEDYDAAGCYLYHLGRGEEKTSFAHHLLQASVCDSMPLEPRQQIEGIAADRGVIMRDQAPTHLTGTPEAVALFELGCPHTLTFETPSELAYQDRVNAHRRFIAACITHHLGKDHAELLSQ